MIKKSPSQLKCPLYPMPKFVEDALMENKLINAYNSRPPYQRNDYLRWINRAKRDATKEKRLNQMLAELKAGNTYMKMKWTPKRISVASDTEKNL